MKPPALLVILLIVGALVAGCTSKPAPTPPKDASPTKAPTGKTSSGPGEEDEPDENDECEAARSYNQTADPKPVDIKEGADVTGPLPAKTWRWTVENASFKAFNVDVDIDGPRNTGFFVFANHRIALHGGSCAPATKADFGATFAVGAAGAHEIHYKGQGIKELGEWTLSIQADQAVVHYDVRVVVEY